MVDIGDLDTLKRRIGHGKPVSFLVGAPFSWDNGAGVPPVSGFIDIIRGKVEAVGIAELEALDAALLLAQPAEKYQRSMRFLYQSFGADFVSQVVIDAVLRARAPGAPPYDPGLMSEGLPKDWSISRAQRGLATLMKLKPDHFRGPVFTTNFDPMVGMALLEVGMSPSIIVFPLDGTINAPVQIASNHVNVFHLHGYWRDRLTLHTNAQLTPERPQLMSSLRRHLDQTNLVVMAYSGWDDIFTTAIASCLNDANFSGEVTWCFYNNSPAEAREQNSALIKKFGNGLQPRVQFFCGVDCHTFFEDYIAGLGITPAIVASKVTSPIPGWDMVTKEYLDSLPPLSGPEAVRYFDGAVPTWRHAVSPLIPKLSHTEVLQDRIASGVADTSASALQLVRAAGGEGKSSTMLQAAANAVLAGSCTVLWRSSANAELNPDTVASLDPATQWLIVIDDAEGLVEAIWACADHLHQRGRTNVFFLIAARDSDWIGVRGDGKSWATRLNRLDDLTMGDLSSDNAGRIVDAWTAQGVDGLRALATVAARDDRITRLVTASKSKGVKSDDGSFFGGLLETRFSSTALVDHVVTMLQPLRGMHIDGGSGTLYDALVYIAHCQAVGMPGLDKRVLASLMDLPAQMVSSAITMPMGKELGAAESRGHVLTRHKRVAEAIVIAVETRLGTDSAVVWGELVKHTARLGRNGQVSRDCHGKIIHAGASLMRDLPNGIDPHRRGEIGIAAAEAACEHLSERVDVIIDLARSLRFAGYPQEAYDHMASEHPKLAGKAEVPEYLRGFLYEWSTCAGNLGDGSGYISDAWLACLSLSDTIPAEVNIVRAKLSCAGLGVAFQHLLTSDPFGVFAKGRRAATEIGWKTRPDPTTTGYFRRHEGELDRAGTPKPVDLDEALAWLAEAAKAAHTELRDPQLRSLQKSGELTFTRLRTAVAGS